ncbi:MAG: hypothetical protein MUF33_06150 [Candidatus Nanopelagicales bacterium]|jgi:hypothetical protein|nr:hypothetical protein [Candidatus Nanopelagicales bacterium]MCU0298086.1 hypothetical protein [Candidatus Nanopelagicales bacterium]
MQHGVDFPAASNGTRSTTATGRAVIADALRAVDPAAARRVEAIKDWRSGYLSAIRDLVVVAAANAQASVAVSAAGLDSLHERFVWSADGNDRPLISALSLSDHEGMDTFEVIGRNERRAEFSVPYRGKRLSGDTLYAQLDDWVARGVAEPSFADAVRAVMANPQWLDLRGQQIAVLGAGAEMGPLQQLLDWGATVYAVDLPRPDVWERIMAVGKRSAGRLAVPVPRRSVQLDTASDAKVAQVAGLDLIGQTDALLAWLREVDGPLTLGNYAYADGGLHVRVSMAIDAVTLLLARSNPGLSLAYLATPTDVFAVPEDAVAMARSRWKDRRTRRILQAPLQLANLFEPAYRDTVIDDSGHEVGISDCLVPQQGPNYALAKRLQRWRAIVARDSGMRVSLNVAPATRTRSVVKNRALAAAYAGAGQFGIEVFSASTANTLMAALLVRDLHDPASAANPEVPLHNPMDLFADAANHGGLWRAAYEPRSVLSLAAVLGLFVRNA